MSGPINFITLMEVSLESYLRIQVLGSYWNQTFICNFTDDIIHKNLSTWPMATNPMNWDINSLPK